MDFDNKINVSMKQRETFRHILTILALSRRKAGYLHLRPGTVHGRLKDQTYANQKIVGTPAAGGGTGCV